MSVQSRMLRRDLRARSGQIVAVAITIFLGIALFGASYDAFQNLQASYQHLYTQLRFADLTVVGGDVSQVVAAGRGLPGVTHVAEREVADVPIRVNGTHEMLGRAVAMPDSGQPEVNRVDVLEGTALDPATSNGVLVEQHMAHHFHIQPGDTLEVAGAQGWVRVTVLGLAASPEYVWPARSSQEILTSPDEFGVLFVPKTLLDGLSLHAVTQQALFAYAPGADTAALDTQITAAAHQAGALDVFDRSRQPSNGALQEDVQGFGEMSFLFPVLFLGAAGMATYVLLTRLVYAQQPLIGLLRASGFRRRSVFRHYLRYGLFIGLLGTIPGVAAGAGLAALITRLYTSAIQVPVVVVRIRPATVIAGLAFGLIGGGLSAWAPARLASRISPAEAMRGVPPGGAVGRPSVFERIFPPLRGAGARTKMVLRGIGRNPRRSVSTVIGVVLAIVLILTSWGMIDTTQILLDRQFLQVQRQDATVILSGTADSAVLEQLRSVSGVAAAEPSAVMDVSLQDGTKQYATILQALPADTQMHGFTSPGGSALTLPSDGLLVGRALHKVLGVQVGDQVTVAFPSLGVSVTDRVGGFVDEPLGTLAYVSLSHLSDLLGPDKAQAATTAALVRYVPGADRAAMRSRLTALPDVLAFQDAHSLYDTAKSFMGLFYAFVGVMLVFGALMAFALIFATVAANVSERRGEIAVLSASGAGRRMVSRLITSENVLLTLLGIPVGLVAGYYLAAYFMSSFSSDLFDFNLRMHVTTPLVTALAVLVTALLSQQPVLRALRRLDMAEEVRRRSL